MGSRVGNGRYGNVYEWLDVLHDPANPLLVEREKNPREDIHLLGAYKQIMSGVPTVVDHYLRNDDRFWDQFPVRIFHRFGRTWTLRQETGWGGTIEEELREAGTAFPYIIHISEGSDESVRGELKALAARGGVVPNAILVHGIAFDGDDFRLVAERGAAVAWCPYSNMFLYDRTLDVRSALDAGINVCLGTDSCLSGSDNLFDEARYAGSVYNERYGEDLDGQVLFSMLTVNAGKALIAPAEIGCLESGALADVLVTSPREDDPVKSFIETRPGDVDLLLVGGRPAFGSARHRKFFEEACEQFSTISVNGKQMLVVGDPAGLLGRIEQRLGSKKELPFLPLDR